MVFSPDRELMASTHGDHNIYVTKTSNGKLVHTLKGHPRTPWCVAFHPTRKGLLASGCLAGHVRVWDLYGQGSEVWRANNVIASLAFHPDTSLLVIATVNKLVFWDWKYDKPFARTMTGSHKEKVRYVKFDNLGHQLITGIANLSGRDASNRDASASPTGLDGRYPSRRLIEPSASDMSLGARPRHHPSLRVPHSRVGPVELIPSGVDPDMSYGRYRSGGVGTAPPPIRPTPNEGSNLFLPQRRPNEYYIRRTGNEDGPLRAATGISSTRQLTSPVSYRSSIQQANSGVTGRTLSDLAAAASRRLMDENAAALERIDMRNLETERYIESARRRITDESGAGGFSHSYASPFVGVNRIEGANSSGLNPSPNQPGSSRRPPYSGSLDTASSESTAREIYMANRTSSRSAAQERYRQLRERRMRRMRFATPLNPEDITAGSGHYREWLHQMNSDPNTSGRWDGNIDDWARILRQRGVQSSSGTDVNLEPDVTATPESLMTIASRGPTADLSRNDPPAAASTSSGGPSSLDRVTDTTGNTDPSTAANDISAHDHTYSTENGIAAATGQGQVGDGSGPRTGGGGGSSFSSGTDAEPSTTSGLEAVQRPNSTLVLLQRHITNMERICRASMADCAVRSHRRQIIKLQSIRRILEDLRRQIRSLRNAPLEEINRRSREAESLGSALGDFRQRNRRRVAAVAPRTALEDSVTAATAAVTSGNDVDEAEGAFDIDDEDVQTSTASRRSVGSEMMNEANSLRHLGIRARRNPLLTRSSRVRPVLASTLRKTPPATNRTRVASAASSGSQGGLTPPRRTSAHQPRVHRMSRAHNQLVAQMRASFRSSLSAASDSRSENLNSRRRSLDGSGNGSMSTSINEPSKKQRGLKRKAQDIAESPSLGVVVKLGVLTKRKAKESGSGNLGVGGPGSSFGGNHLRSLSQRLERMVRSNREEEEEEDEETRVGSLTGSPDEEETDETLHRLAENERKMTKAEEALERNRRERSEISAR